MSESLPEQTRGQLRRPSQRKVKRYLKRQKRKALRRHKLDEDLPRRTRYGGYAD